MSSFDVGSILVAPGLSYLIWGYGTGDMKQAMYLGALQAGLHLFFPWSTTKMGFMYGLLAPGAMMYYLSGNLIYGFAASTISFLDHVFVTFANFNQYTKVPPTPAQVADAKR